MKHRFGGLLSLALGAVLIFTGLNGGASGAVGGIAKPTTCGSVVVGVSAVCPTGKITITSVTDTSATGAATPPSTWSVKVTSTCLDPNTSSAVSRTVSVPNGGSAAVTDLYVYTDDTSTASCAYDLVQTAVAGFTTTFDPASPVTLPYDGGDNARAVTLNNVAAATTSSAAPSSTTPASSPASSSGVPTSSAATSSSAVARARASSSTAPLAATGPRSDVRSSVWIGIALCLLGLVLLFGGRVRRIAGRHHH